MKPTRPPQTPDSYQEDSLLERARQMGDIEAFGWLYERYRARLLRICVRRLRGDLALAEDIVQETFLRAYAKLGTFEEGRQIWPWLATLAARLSIDVQRRDARLSVTDNQEALISVTARATDRFDPTFESALQREQRVRIGTALQGVSSRHRRALLLHAHGWRYAEIADVEGMTVDAVKAVLRRSRNKVRLHWKAQPGTLDTDNAFRAR